MCGRYATSRDAADLSTLFDALDATGAPLPPDYNVAPTDPVPVVRISARRGGQRMVDVARWGLVPAWAPDRRAGARMINARAETVATSPAFAPSFARRRCLVPADGWYEWVRTGRGRQAYYLTAADGAVLAFAGLWTSWGTGDQQVLTCSIVTTAALGDLSLVHSRMPLLLPASGWARWLTGPADPAALLAPPPPGTAGPAGDPAGRPGRRRCPQRRPGPHRPGDRATTERTGGAAGRSHPVLIRLRSGALADSLMWSCFAGVDAES